MPRIGFVAASVLAAVAVVACGGSDGAQGPAGPAGAQGPGGAQGPAGAAGAQGPAGTGTTPSLSSVIPHAGLLDRELDVVITAEAATLDSSATVDFGKDVTVSNVSAVSATSLVAHLKIAKTAAVGARDVTLTAAGKMLKGTGAFVVAAPLQVKVTGGNQKQGGVFTADLYDLDHAAFDTANLSFGPQVLLAPWTNQRGPTSTNASMAFVIDPLAAAGKAGIVAGNLDLNGNFVETFESSPEALTIVANPATALTASKDDVIANPGDTALYKYSTTGAAIVHTTFTFDAMTELLQPFVFVYPTSGASADLLSNSSVNFLSSAIADTVYPVTAAADTYVVVGDEGLAGGKAADYGFTINVTKTDVPAANVVMETSSTHNTVPTAQALTALPAIVNGKAKSMPSPWVNDIYKITVATGDLYEVSLVGSKFPLIAAALCDAAANGTDINFQTCDGVAQATGPVHSGFGVMQTAVPANVTVKYLIVQSKPTAAAATYSVSVRKTN